MDDTYRATTSVANLRRRASLLQQTRAFFDERGFVEVQTPILSQDVIIDRHLDPMTVEVNWYPSRHPGQSGWFLQTSPEQNMKRLLASGMTNIYQLGPVFRAAEVGQRHNPEFTMLEWYEVGADFETGVLFLEELIQQLLATPNPMRTTYSKVFQNYTGVDPLSISIEELAEWAFERKLVDRLDWSTDRDDYLNLIFSLEIQDRLGHDAPLVVSHFPASQAALAKLGSEDQRTAERYEIFYKGLELANGYHELLDAKILRDRNEEANRLRVLDGKAILPEANRLLDAMEAGLPACSGCALGFDRLVMIAVGATDVSEVLCFPWDRA